MDVLKNKSFKDYKSISRYSTFPIYYHNEDSKYIYSLTSHLIDNIQYVAHKVSELDNLDSLAFKYYGRPDYYWIIADFNKIQDPYIKLKDHFDVIKIPTISSISFE